MFIKHTFIGLAAMVCLASGAPALAQSMTMTPTPAPAPGPKPTQCSGNFCPGTSSISMAGMASFGGTAGGVFGAFGSDGKMVPNSTLTGKVEISKTGFSNTDIKLNINGAACGITCTNTSAMGTVGAGEDVAVKVTSSGTTPGVMYGVRNEGNALAIVGLAINYQPNPALTTQVPSPTTPN